MFDRFVIVDWSANGRPKRGRDSIWIAVLDTDIGGDDLRLLNPPTRALAERTLRTTLDEGHASATLVGVDFSLGFPAGTAAALGLRGTPWSAMWELLDDRIVDDAGNANNRFAVAAQLNATMTGGPAPFWGCPPSACSPELGRTKPRPPHAPGPSGSPGSSGPPRAPERPGEWRLVEQVLRTSGHRPFSSWQLLGAGAVGGQSLVGIPVVRRLVAGCGARASVWPFSDGLTVPGGEPGTVTFVEVWPSWFPADAAVDATDDVVRDAAQVTMVARRLAALDRVGALASWFVPDVDAGRREVVVGEEGWILGVAGDV